jgi:hypothetical protein
MTEKMAQPQEHLISGLNGFVNNFATGKLFKERGKKSNISREGFDT